MNLSRRRTASLVLLAVVLLAVAVSMTVSTATVDIGAGPFEIWSLPFRSSM